MTDSETIQRLVIKIGSAVITSDDDGQLNVDRNTIFQLARQISQAIANGCRVVIVSSGAVALGIEELEMNERPAEMSKVQALAATGQGLLMQLWRDAFGRYGLRVGQVLLTHSDLADRQRYLNVRATLDALIGFNVIPVVNENDTVMTDEITVGDNDVLAAQVAKLVGANRLLLLTSVEGLLDAQGRVVANVGLEDNPMDLVQSEKSTQGRGGMTTKIEAARMAGKGGIQTVVANGRGEGVVTKVCNREPVGTLFQCEEKALASRKHWIGFTLRPTGTITIDDGAQLALQNEGASLLPIGIVQTEGQFKEGEVVKIVGPKGVELARGLTRMDSRDIQSLLGKKGAPVVHRDDLVIW